MNASPTPGWDLRLALSAEVSAAADMVLGELPPEQRRVMTDRLQAAPADSALPSCLWVAATATGLRGALLVEAQAGRVAGIWPPRGDPSGNWAVPLVQAACAALREQGVQLVQALLPEQAGTDQMVLEAAGFRQLAELLYLVATRHSFPSSPPVAPLEFAPASPETDERLAEIITGTYHGSLDCPELDGLRSPDDVLAGYRATGHHRPDCWWFARHQGQDVGCALVADFPDLDQWELMYLGLLPHSRGHGWGTHVIRFVQWQARVAGRARVVAAVDAANAPAIGAYAAGGFVAWDQRRALVRVL